MQVYQTNTVWFGSNTQQPPTSVGHKVVSLVFLGRRKFFFLICFLAYFAGVEVVTINHRVGLLRRCRQRSLGACAQSIGQTQGDGLVWFEPVFAAANQCKSANSRCCRVFGERDIFLVTGLLAYFAGVEVVTINQLVVMG